MPNSATRWQLCIEDLEQIQPTSYFIFLFFNMFFLNEQLNNKNQVFVFTPTKNKKLSCSYSKHGGFHQKNSR